MIPVWTRDEYDEKDRQLEFYQTQTTKTSACVQLVSLLEQIYPLLIYAVFRMNILEHSYHF